MTDPPGPGRRTFAPTVLAGLAGAGLAALGGTRPWAAVPDDGTGRAAGALASSQAAAGSGQEPLAGALALVALACWGVLLVARGRVRRLLAALAALAALGVLATVLVGAGRVRADVRETLAGLGAGTAAVGWTPWLWVSGAGALVALAAAAVAVRTAATWPALGRRYDAPEAVAPAPGSTGNLDLWRSLDRGDDPTDPADRAGPAGAPPPPP